MLRIFVLIACLVVAAAPVSLAAPIRILVPVLGGGDTVHAYLYADNGGEPAAVDAESLRPWVRAALSPEAQAAFEALTSADGKLALADAPQAGFSLTYDDQLAALRVSAAPQSMQARDLSLLEDTAPHYANVTEPAAFSGFFNFRGGMDYVHDNPTLDGRQPSRLDVDGALNYKGWVVEGRADYLEGDARPWARDETRIVHDWPEKMLRFAAGDLFYPLTAFQSYVPMLGVSFARNFTLQPYRVTQPTGRTSFVLTSPSRVDILVNGQKMRSMQLAPGPYDVSDFPVSGGGSSAVTLVITDATGRVEQKTFPLVSDQYLLKAGLHEYSYNAGVVSENRKRLITYTSKPVFSGFHRYGFSDALTGGVNMQAGADVVQLGSSLVRAFPWGTLGAEAALSRGDGGVDGAGVMSYRFYSRETDRDFSASAEYKGSGFESLGDDGAGNIAAWELATRYSQPVMWNMNMGVGGRYRFARGANARDEWSYSVNLSRQIFETISASLSMQQRSREGSGVYMNFTWTPQQGRHTVSASLDTATRSRDVDWMWRDGNRWQAGAGLSREGDNMRATGNAAYTGQRFELALRDDITSSMLPDAAGRMGRRTADHRTRFTAATAVAFADDHVALSRPINSGFVMLARHETLKGRVIGVNPGVGENGADVAYQAQIDALGPAVIADAVPYVYRPVNIDTKNVPGEYDVGADHFVALPGYKSGAAIMIGSAANVYADGHVVDQHGQPIGMEAGRIACTDVPEQEFFTNAKGRFRISRLRPGACRMVLYRLPDAEMAFTIPETDGKLRYEAGQLVAQVTP